MIDYSAIKLFFATHLAAKLADDPNGRGQFESAFFHTIEKTSKDTRGENEAQIAALQSDLHVLTTELQITRDIARRQQADLNANLNRINDRRRVTRECYIRLKLQRDELLAENAQMREKLSGGLYR